MSLNALRMFLALLCVTAVFSSATVYAQEYRSDTPKAEATIMIADVNIVRVATSTSGDSIETTFTLVSSMGNQDHVRYGMLVRGESSGDILESFTVEDDLTLVEGEQVERIFPYQIPDYLPEAGILYLSVYSDRGLPLAFTRIMGIPKGNPRATCGLESGSISCEGGDEGVAQVIVRADSPQGVVVASTEAPLAGGRTRVATIASLVEELAPGLYSTFVGVTDKKGDLIGAYATEFWKDGDIARIVSAPVHARIEGGRVFLDVTIYAVTNGGPDGLSYSLDLGGCADAPLILARTADVQMLSLSSHCSTGMLTISLMRGESILDSLATTFAVGAVPVPTNDLRIKMLAFMALLVALSAIGVLAYALRKHRTHFAVLVIALATLVPTSSAFGATYVIGGQATYNTCITGSYPGCAEPSTELGYRTLGTVTVPTYVAPGATYGINVSQSLPGTVRTECKNVASGTYEPCGVDQVATYIYEGLPPPTPVVVYGQILGSYNTLPPGMGNSLAGYLASNPSVVTVGSMTFGNASQLFSRTAPAVGADELAFLQIADAGHSIRCLGNCLTYPYTYNLITVNVNPMCTPTGSFYQWNGLNWDDFGTPGWMVPGPNYALSDQGPLLINSTYLGGGVWADSSGGYPEKASFLRCDPSRLACRSATPIGWSVDQCASSCTQNVQLWLAQQSGVLPYDELWQSDNPSCDAVMCGTYPLYYKSPAEISSAPVCSGNSAPVVTPIANPVVTTIGDTATIGVVASDPDGTIVSSTWTFISGPVTPTITSPGNTTTQVGGLTTVGDYVFEVVVRDDTGAETSVQVTVRVQAPPVPVITSATVNGSPSLTVPSGTPFRVVMTSTGGVSGTWSRTDNGGSGSPNWTDQPIPAGSGGPTQYDSGVQVWAGEPIDHTYVWTFVTQNSMGVSSAPRSASLTILGAVPSITASLGIVDFGNVTLGNSNARTITITNNGQPGSLLTGTILPGDPHLTCAPCSYSVPVGAPQTITLTWSPGSLPALPLGAWNSTVTLNSDAASVPDLTLPVVGVVTSPIVFAPASPVDFGRVVIGTVKEVTITIRNISSSPIPAFTLTGLSAPYTCAQCATMQGIPANGTREVTIRFTPASPAGLVAPQTVQLSGRPPQDSFTLRGESVAPAFEFKER